MDKLESQAPGSGSEHLSSFDALSGGAASASTSTKESYSGAGTGTEEAQGNNGNEKSQGTAAPVYQSIRRVPMK